MFDLLTTSQYKQNYRIMALSEKSGRRLFDITNSTCRNISRYRTAFLDIETTVIDDEEWTLDVFMSPA